MPFFPGLSYPLVPGYEAIGEVVEAPRDADVKVGDTVFVPGAACFDGVAALFGGASSLLVTDPARAARLDSGIGPEGALLALAATARHALAAPGSDLPELIVGHGVLGRLLARLTIAAGGPAPRSGKSRRPACRGHWATR
jgi:3-hydroxyethyl bacteriochlorophyllide a dehydrogenase